MADAGVALFGIALFCVAVFVAVRLYAGWRRRSQQWQISETTGMAGAFSGYYHVMLKRGQESIAISAESEDGSYRFSIVNPADPDWDTKVALLRDEAKYKLRTLNDQ